jgi:transposase-like protein
MVNFMVFKAKMIRKKRFFSEAFKKELVRLFEQGKYSVLQLSKLYGIRPSLIYLWIYKYSSFNEAGYRVIEMKQSSTSKVKALEQRIRELEKIVGQKQIKIDFLEEMISVAKEELNVDIKKKHSTPLSAASTKGKKS